VYIISELELLFVCGHYLCDYQISTEGLFCCILLLELCSQMMTVLSFGTQTVAQQAMNECTFCCKESYRSASKHLINKL
jgi:hypothetical protein